MSSVLHSGPAGQLLGLRRIHDVAAPQQNIQQSRTLQVVQLRFAHADIERPAGALIRYFNLIGGRRVRSRIQAIAPIHGIEHFVTAATEMIKTKSFLTKGNSDRPRATAPITRFRITHCSLFPLVARDSILSDSLATASLQLRSKQRHPTVTIS